MKDITHFKPRDPKNGDFRFEGVTKLDVDFDPDDWPADPSAYRASLHFKDYLRNGKRYITGDIIRETITGDQMVPAINNCGAFYHTVPGIVFYIVVGWDRSSIDAVTESFPEDATDRIVVSGWPHVFDRDEALFNTRYSSRALNEIQTINQNLNLKRYA